MGSRGGLVVAVLLAAVACETKTEVGADVGLATQAPKSKATPVGSRELKVLLDGDAFAEVDEALPALQDDILELVDELGRDASGTLTELDKERRVAFLDVPGSCPLRDSGYIVRERADGNKRDATLKFRSPDRYLAAAAKMSARADLDAETKLEEDTSPPYTGAFSHSTKVKLPSSLTITTVDDLTELFPGVASLELDPETPLAPVGGLLMQERVYGPLEIDLGKHEAEMTLTLWYASEADTTPVVAELSFKYEAADEAYEPKSVRRAKALYEMIQNLDSWIAPDSVTKTTFVYDAAPEFCSDAATD